MYLHNNPCYFSSSVFVSSQRASVSSSRPSLPSTSARKALTVKSCTILTAAHLSFPFSSPSYLQNGYDDAKEADGAAEDLHDENLDEQAGVLGVRQSRSAAHDAHADAAEEVGEAHGQASSKHGITWTEGVY